VRIQAQAAPSHKSPTSRRDAAILKQRLRGVRVKALAEKYGVSGQRVSQLLKRQAAREGLDWPLTVPVPRKKR
jgi:hypothetical protein